VTGTAGAARRREVGNSITQINIADVPDRPVTTSDLLQGSAPGVDVWGGGSEAGQGKQIRLRGNSSVSMTNQPIIYIDGIRMRSDPLPIVNSLDTNNGRGGRVTTSPLDQLNPADIERIEIIKGSAATTLYGTEASAGVIQVFTKRGSSGAPVWSAEIQQGTGWAKQFGMNGVEYLHMEHYLRDSWFGGGYEGGEHSIDCITDDTAENPDAPYPVAPVNARWEGVNSSPEGACSWPGAFWTQNYSLSVRGGTQAFQYFMSGQYQDDQYLQPNDLLERYSFRGNFTVTPIDNLQVTWNTGYSNQWTSQTSTANNAQGITLNAFRQERNYWSLEDPRVIAELVDYDAQQTNENLTTGLTLSYAPIPALTNRFTAGYDFVSQEGRNIRPFGFYQFQRGSATNDTFQNRLMTFDYVGSYAFDLTQTVGSTFSWGGQAVGNEERAIRGYGENFPGATEPTVSSGAFTFAEEERERVWNAGFFFQNVFDVSDKYFLTAGVRVDGNSAFGGDFGLQVYPKVSASWVISDESFWTETLGTMKLRAAYGQSGRAPGAFDAVRTWDAIGFAGDPAFVPENLGNPDLGPEVTSEFELGFDGAWVDNRVNAVFTYYRQITTDALMDVSAIPSQGFTQAQLRNVGAISNRGIEFQVDAEVMRAQNWGVDVGLGITTNKSKVESLCRGETEPSEVVLARDPSAECISEFDALGGRIIEGYSVPMQWGDRVANPDNVPAADCSQSQPTNRCWEYADYEGTSVVNPAGGEDTPVGPAFPETFLTPSLTVRFPFNISVSARGEYRGGHYAFASPVTIGRGARSPICFPYYVDPAGRAIDIDGDGMIEPADGDFSDLALKDDTPSLWRERCTVSNGRDFWFKADYFKLRSLSATIPMDFAFPDRISNSTLTLTLQNSYAWYSEMPWYDTEIYGNLGANQGGAGTPSERLPAPATFRMALRVTF
jgi:outer membrane receptor protein involved in Fe transport